MHEFPVLLRLLIGSRSPARGDEEILERGRSRCMGAKLLSSVSPGSPGLQLRAGRTADRDPELYEEVRPRRSSPTALRLVSGGRAAKTAPDGVALLVAENDRLKAEKRYQRRLLAIICH